MPEPRAFDVEIAIEKLNDTNHQVLIKAGSRNNRSEIRTLINSIWNQVELPKDWNESISVPIYKKGRL